MSKRYARFLEDGTLDIASSVVKVGKQTFYHPSDKTLEALGFKELVEVTGAAAEREGYKVVDQGFHVEVRESDGKKIITNALKYLKIVDNPPNITEGLYIRNDYWKEIEDKWVHIYDVASSKRHSKHKKKGEDKPVEEGTPTASKFEEQQAAAEAAKAEEKPVEETPQPEEATTTEE